VKPDQAQEEVFGDWVDVVQVDDVIADAKLGEDGAAERELSDGNLTGGELADGEVQAGGELAEADRAERGLAEREHEANAELADRYEAHRQLPNGADARCDAADRDDTVGDDSLVRLGANAVRVVHQRQAAEIKVRFEFGEGSAVGVCVLPPDTIGSFKNLIFVGQWRGK